MATGSKFQTQLISDTRDGIGNAYLFLQGFDTLMYYSIWGDDYNGLMPKLLKEVDQNMSDPKYDKDYLVRHKEQLLRFAKEKDIHLKNGGKVTCL